MRVIILNQAFHPDVVATGQYAADLAVALSAKGHEVTVICSSRGYDEPEIRFSSEEIWNGVKILRVWSTGLGKNSKLRRAVDFATFMFSCAWRLCWLDRSDVVIALTSPPLISFLASLAVPYRASRLVFWSMDLNPDEAIAAGWLRTESLVGRTLLRMLAFSLHRADRSIALDRFMKQRIEAKGVSGDRVVIIPPWSREDHVRFDAIGREKFRARHNLTDKFVVMYSGNHSPCHPLITLLEAAERLDQRPDIVFGFVGGGSEFPRLKEYVRQKKLTNVICLPYQPMEELSASLSAADLHVVIMGDKYVGIVHPSKIYNILAVGCDFLYIGPVESHVSDIMQRVGEFGVQAYAARHGDIKGVTDAILSARTKPRSVTDQPSNPNEYFSKGALISEMIRVIE